MRTGAQRAVGWCETVERSHGTRLGASVELPNIWKVGADGIHRYMERI